MFSALTLWKGGVRRGNISWRPAPLNGARGEDSMRGLARAAAPWGLSHAFPSAARLILPFVVLVPQTVIHSDMLCGR